MRREVIIWPLAIAAALVQATYLAAWRPLGIVPDLVLIIVVRLALQLGATEALTVAVLGGLTLDLAAGDRFGLRTAVLVAITVGLVVIRRQGLVAGFWLEMGLVATAALIYGGLQVIALWLGQAGSWRLLWLLVLTVLVDLGLAAILYRPLGRLCRLAQGEDL